MDVRSRVSCPLWCAWMWPPGSEPVRRTNAQLTSAPARRSAIRVDLAPYRVCGAGWVRSLPPRADCCARSPGHARAGEHPIPHARSDVPFPRARASDGHQQCVRTPRCNPARAPLMAFPSTAVRAPRGCPTECAVSVVHCSAAACRDGSRGRSHHARQMSGPYTAGPTSSRHEHGRRATAHASFP
jgi:hypothetical protein